MVMENGECGCAIQNSSFCEQLSIKKLMPTTWTWDINEYGCGSTIPLHSAGGAARFCSGFFCNDNDLVFTMGSSLIASEFASIVRWRHGGHCGKVNCSIQTRQLNNIVRGT